MRGITRTRCARERPPRSCGEAGVKKRADAVTQSVPSLPRGCKVNAGRRKKRKPYVEKLKEKRERGNNES